MPTQPAPSPGTKDTSFDSDPFGSFTSAPSSGAQTDPFGVPQQEQAIQQQQQQVPQAPKASAADIMNLFNAPSMQATSMGGMTGMQQPQMGMPQHNNR